MKLRFKVDGLENGKVVFEAGKVYEVSNEKGSADRWIRRGAEEVLDEEVELSEPAYREAVDPEVEAHGVSKYVIRRHKRLASEVTTEVTPEVVVVQEADIVKVEEVNEVPAEVKVEEVVEVVEAPAEEKIVNEVVKKENKKSKPSKVK